MRRSITLAQNNLEASDPNIYYDANMVLTDKKNAYYRESFRLKDGNFVAVVERAESAKHKENIMKVVKDRSSQRTSLATAGADLDWKDAIKSWKKPDDSANSK